LEDIVYFPNLAPWNLYAPSLTSSCRNEPRCESRMYLFVA
jgi:hypothetical protein